MANYINIRYQITPQMKEYDLVGQAWLPYLMYFHSPDHSSKVLNTDSRGFRISYKGNHKIEDTLCPSSSSVCLLVGGSFVFGVGATDDGNTIPSKLNMITGHTWLNFGGRAFSSTQELMLFLFYYQQLTNVKKIVILSGLNNLVLYYLSPSYSKELGSFFYFSQYKRSMAESMISAKRKLARSLLGPFLGEGIDYQNISKRDLLRQMLPMSGANASCQAAGCKNARSISAAGNDKADMLFVLNRDISAWKLFAQALGIDIYYVLQPMANWIDKRPSKEESLLFGALDQHPANHWRVLKQNLGIDQYKWFCGQTRDICADNKIKFFDMNRAISDRKLDGEWLFCDRAHCTDQGYQVVAEIIKNEVIN